MGGLVVFLLGCAASGAGAEDVKWLVRYDGKTPPQSPQWTRAGNEAAAQMADGVLRLNDNSREDVCCYRASFEPPPDGSEIVVEARVRVKELFGYQHGGKGKGAPRLYRPWLTGSPIGILVSDGRHQEGLLMCPAYIGTFLNRFWLMDTTDDFHVYRMVIRGTDMSISVDGEERIPGKGAFWKPDEDGKPYIQFGSNAKQYMGEAEWDYVRLGVRPAAKGAETAALKITVGEPWTIPRIEGVGSTRPYLYNVGQGILLMSVAQGPDAINEPYGVLKSTDMGKTWTAVPGLTKKVFAPQPMIRLADGSIFGASRWTADCLNSHTKKLVSLAGISYRFDPKAETFEMYESAIAPHERLTHHVVFDRHIFQRADGSLLAVVYNGPDGCLILESKDLGRRWEVFSKIGGRYEPGVAFFSPQRATAVTRYDSASPLRQVWSEDGGKTWSDPVLLEFGSVDPDLVVMSNGVLACSFGRPGCGIAFSTDEGKTWCAQRVITDRSGFNYTTISEVSPGRLLYIHDAPPLTALYVDVERTK